MKEIGIDISKQSSDIIELTYLKNAELIITLCGDAADEKWAFFQRVRDEIKDRIQRFAETDK